MRHTWDLDTYMKFSAYRERGAEDLLAHVHLAVEGDIYDLGCGPGTVTKRLRERWPDRQVVGLDSSPEMLHGAQQNFGDSGIVWRTGDIASWEPVAPAAFVFANASLHWLSRHEELFPRLMRGIRPGGVLAVQMPMTGRSPFRACVGKVTSTPRWRDVLKDAVPHADPAPAAFYYDLLSPLSTKMDLWETDYHHVLGSTELAATWMSGTELVPFLSLLREPEKSEFLRDYRAHLDEAYRPQADGSVLFTMPRLFIIATRK